MNRAEITFFKVITYLLLPIAFFFGLIASMMLVIALGNLQLLLPVFLLACFAIYIFTSFRFSQNIAAGIPASQKLRDWMRVNAFVCIFMSVLFIMNAAALLYFSDAKLQEMIQPTIDSMGSLAGGLNAEQMTGRMKSFSVFLMVMSVILLIHIIINFRLQKIFSQING